MIESLVSVFMKLLGFRSELGREVRQRVDHADQSVSRELSTVQAAVERVANNAISTDDVQRGLAPLQRAIEAYQQTQLGHRARYPLGIVATLDELHVAACVVLYAAYDRAHSEGGTRETTERAKHLAFVVEKYQCQVREVLHGRYSRFAWIRNRIQAA